MPTPAGGQAELSGRPAVSLAGVAGQSLLALLSAAMSGGRPLISLPLLDYFAGDGGYGVSDAPTASALLRLEAAPDGAINSGHYAGAAGAYGFAARQGVPPAESVSWMNVAGVTAAGNSLTKPAGGATAWDAGAMSTKAIASGDGYVEFTASESGAYRMCGLSHGDDNQSYTDIDFAVYLYYDGTVHIYEAGVWRAQITTYVAGDRFRVSVASGVVSYSKNGLTLYTSAMAPRYPLLVDTSLYNPGATLNNVVISGSLVENVAWSSVVGVTAAGNNLSKGGAAAWDAGAVSTRSIASGDGYVEFTASETNTDRMCGLSLGDGGQSYTDIDFAISLSNGGYVYAYEGGVYKAAGGPYQTGDKLRVSVEAGVVKYAKNGSVFYTSSLAPQYPLLVDTSLHDMGATIKNAVISAPQSDSAGSGTGLRGDYYDNLDFTAYRATRTDPTVDFWWDLAAPHPSIGSEELSIRWTGMVVPRYSETYTFYTTSDDGARLWVDGQLLIDKWIDQGATEWTGQVTLEAGRAYPIKMEFYDRFWGAVARLAWSSPSQPKEIIPQSQLYPCWKSTEQFVRDFFQAALARQPNPLELQDWSARLAQAQGDSQLVEEARGLGYALFNLSPQSAYAARNRSDGDFVADLYRGYLQRAPEPAGLNYWTSQVAVVGRANVREAFAQAIEFSEKVRRLCGTSAAAGANGGAGYNFASARLDPANRTGATDPYSRNFHWSVPLVSLPGRAGLDLGLTLSYNSLVWTKDATGVTFDADWGFPSPGFRLGFPVVHPRFFDPRTGKYAFLLLTPAGERVELRQVGTSNVYESADSSRLQLTAAGGSLVLRTPDGTSLSFFLLNGQYQCVQVLDRDGNYISVNYDQYGQIGNVVDTLGRTITFNYDSFQNLSSITQAWKRETANGPVDETHTWATFGFGVAHTLGANASLFSNLAVMGTQGGAQIPVLRQVGLADGTLYKFEYNPWGQVFRISRSTPRDDDPNVWKERAYTVFDLPGAQGGPPQTDCPRFTERRVWAEGWMGDTDGTPIPSEEAVTGYSQWSPDPAFCNVTVPDGTLHKEVYATSVGGWQKGLTTSSEVWSGGEVKKTTTLTWEHDGAANAAYPTNPRVRQAAVSDPEGNGRLTRIEYTSAAEFSLPRKVEECSANGSIILRTTVTEYNVPNLGEYTSRRIIGLPSFTYLYEGTVGAANLRSKVGFVYDEPNTATDTFLASLPSAATQHDGAGYGSGFRWRGNVNRVRRYDVNGSGYVESKTYYNITGSVVKTASAPNHETTISYADSFYLGVNRSNPALQTFAYPTAVTVKETVPTTVNVSTSTQYLYDLGLPRESTDPKGAVVRTRYDKAGRPLRAARYDGAAEKGHTELVYPASNGFLNAFTAVEAGKEPAYSTSVFDGAGRARAQARYLPSAGDDATGAYTGNYSGQRVEFDSMGRVARTYHPTEINAGWAPAGADAGTGWVYTTQTYDWQGRPRVTTHPDGAKRETIYEGCGCAGGAMATTRDESGYRRRVIYDVLGRVEKSQVLSIQFLSEPISHGQDADVYSTTTNTYNARDQLTEVRVQAGVAGAAQVTTMEYDGHGRLWKQRGSSQTADTVYTYNADDTPNVVTDPRGATATYSYNNRGLVTGITYGGAGITASPPVAFGYDAAGNRTSMTDGLGGVTYQYDALSRLISETRQFADPGPPNLNASFTLTYGYNLADELKSVTDNTFSKSFSFTYDRAGRLKKVDSTGYGVSQFITGIEYRAQGAAGTVSYGNGKQLSAEFDSRLRLKRLTMAGVIDRTYGYYGNGQLATITDHLDDNNDRSYGYDVAGRVDRALSGFEARPGGQPAEGWGPYRQTYAYDEWGNMTNRTWRSWTTAQNGSTVPVDNFYSASYDNRNRLTSSTGNTTGSGPWQYDPGGNLTQSTSNTQTYSYGYNQAGQTVSSAQTGQATQQMAYDGDGLRAKLAIGTNVTYYVRSTALGGQIISEVNSTGQRLRGYVYAGGELLARQEGTQVAWEHRDPSGAGIYRTNAAGVRGAGGEYDPLGVSNPPSPGIIHPGSPPYQGGLTSVPDMGCSVDGIPTPCDTARWLVSRGTALPCPNNDCGPRFYGSRWEFLRFTEEGLFYTPLRPGRPTLQVMTPEERARARRTVRERGRNPTGNRSAEVLHVSASTFTSRLKGFGIVAQTPQSQQVVLDWYALKSCIEKMFPDIIDFTGRAEKGNAYFRGTLRGWFSNSKVSVDSDTSSYTDVQLGQKYPEHGGGPLNGVETGQVTATSDGYASLNFIASTVTNKAVFQSVWVHELGNSLSSITRRRFVARDQHVHRDGDTGAALEECVYGGKVGGDGSLIPSRQRGYIDLN